MKIIRQVRVTRDTFYETDSNMGKILGWEQGLGIDPKDRNFVFYKKKFTKSQISFAIPDSILNILKT